MPTGFFCIAIRRIFNVCIGVGKKYAEHESIVDNNKIIRQDNIREHPVGIRTQAASQLDKNAEDRGRFA